MRKSAWFTTEVIGKSVEQRGFIFKRSAYIVALKIFGTDGEYKTHSKEVAFEQYCDFEVGKKIQIRMYSEDGGYTWNFERGE